MPNAYLTVDDSPSVYTGELLEYLAENDIQAVFFCRGEFLQVYQDVMIRALQEGHILGNHSFAHIPAGSLPFSEWKMDFERCEAILNEIHALAKVERSRKLYRFPYIDRGDGDRIERRFPEFIRALSEGAKVTLNDDEKTLHIQDYLKRQGFTQPYAELEHPLFHIPQIRGGADCHFTYSSCDWMLTDRHKGQQKYKTIQDLKDAIDCDPWLNDQSIADHVFLFHDDREGIFNVVKSLIDHLKEKGFEFKRL